MTKLPPESGNFDGPFEANDAWLTSAPEELQILAMRKWFLDRYEDPAVETPWDGEEKKYIFVWGGPYDPNDVIQDRFGGVVEFETMYSLIRDLWTEVGDEWAPKEHEGIEYDEYISHVFIDDRQNPRAFLTERVAQIFKVLESIEISASERRLVNQMAHGSLIAALEAYLADTLSYWVENDETVLRRFVSTNKDFQQRTLTLSEIFPRFENIKREIKDYFSGFVWHKLNKVKPILSSSLEIEMPDIAELTKEIIVRHDIVHRAGRKADGSELEIEMVDLIRVREAIKKFSDKIENELAIRFPIDF